MAEELLDDVQTDADPGLGLGDGPAPEADRGAADRSAADHGLEPALLAQAREFGIGEDEARGYGEKLPDVLRLIQRNAVERFVDQQRRQAAEHETKQERRERLAKLELEFGEYADEQEKARWTRLNDHYHGALDSALFKLERLEAAETARRQQAFVSEFDGFLAEAAIPELGTAPQGKATPAEVRAREAVVETMSTLELMRAHQGLPPLPERELIAQAVRLKYGDKLAANAAREERDRVKDRLRDARGKFTAAPRGREERREEAFDEKRAVRNIAQFMREKGWAPEYD